MQSTQDYDFGTLGEEAKYKLQSDNDIKIIIQGRNSQTGIGKTTLAIQLCRFIDEHGWTAQEKAFIDTQEYIDAHLDYPQGSALLFDEIEGAADSRRSTSHENVELSQAWAKMRARNIATVVTLPTTSMLDKRLLELADYWILVKQRGVAQPFKINVNDFQPFKLPQRVSLPGDEHISFPDLPNHDSDKKYLDELKDDMLRSGDSELMRKAEHERILSEKTEKAREEAARERRDEIMADVYKEFDEATYEKIGQLDSIDMRKQSVSDRIKKVDRLTES